MFDSPIAYCKVQNNWISLAQTLDQCASRNHCSAPSKCGLATCFKAKADPLPVKLKISMLNIAHSETLDTYIQAHAEKLHALHPAVIETDVTLELLSRRHVRGNEYAARMELRMPGHCVNIHHVTSEDAYTALRESFSAAHRQLSDAKRDVSRSRSFQRA